MAGVAEDVEGLCFDIGVIEGGPLEVILGQLSVGRLVALLAHGLDGLRTVFGLLGTGNRG